MTIYFITGNDEKFLEIEKIIPKLKQLKIDLVEIQEIDAKKIIKAKLLEALKHKKGEFIVEDTSLYLDCLNGLPGPLIKWFMEKIGNQGLFDLTQKLKNDVAEARTIIGYAKNSKEIYYFEGSVKGKIVSPRGENGFGWDAILKVDGYAKTLGELSRDEKNRISMRKKAADKLKTFLDKKIIKD